MAAWFTLAKGLRPNRFVLSALIIAQLVCFLGGYATMSMAEDLIPIRLVSMLKLDDQGLSIGFPAYVFYDRQTSETYVASGNGRITIYNSEFFPQISLGTGRGIYRPTGIFVTENGDLYVCQARQGEKAARIKILNAAFFPVRDITFEGVPGLNSDYVPSRVAVAKNGRVYAVGEANKGAIVFDKNGKFLHILAPKDQVFGRKVAPKAPKSAKSKGKEKAASDKAGGGEGQDTGADLNMPDELMPKSRVENDEPVVENKETEVYVTQVTIDKKGRIYLTSLETSKTYVYDEDEKFLFTFGEKGGSSSKLSRPYGVAVDVDRDVMYVVDYMRHTILVYGYDTGKFYFEFGGRGASPLWFNFPDSIAVDRAGNVIVADMFNKRVQVIDINMDARLKIMAESFPDLLEPKKPAAPVKEVRKKILVPVAPLAVPSAIVQFVMPKVLVVPVPEKHEVHLKPAAAQPISLAAINEQIAIPPKPVLAVKQITPKKVKKVKQHVVKVPKVVPPPVKVVENKVPSIEAKEIVVDLGKGRVIRLPAALGVYGPVMTIGLVGGWYLYGEVTAPSK